MTIVLPFDVAWQAVLALVAALVSAVLGMIVMHHAWRYHDCRGERDFILGLILVLVGLGWLTAAGAITLGSLYRGTSDAEEAIQQVVVFANATVRLSVLLLAAHVIWDGVRRRASRRST